MAKKNEIKYNILYKTAGDNEVMLGTKNGINYIGNSYCAIFSMNDEEFEMAKTKAKAISNSRLADAVDNIIDNINKNKKKIDYTKICYDSYDGMIHFFRSEDGDIIALQGKFFDIVKDMKINHIYGINNANGVLFELTDGRNVMIMPYRINLDNIDKIIEKIYK